MKTRGSTAGVLIVLGIALVSADLYLAARDLLAPASRESASVADSHAPSSAQSIRFEPNVGQAADDVDFVARGGSDVALVSASGLYFPSFHQVLVGANPEAAPSGEERMSSVSNYYLGSDPDAWRTGVANFGRVVYRDAYPGIDLEYAGTVGQLNYQFVVRPGADPNAIALSLEGVDSVTVADDRVTAETASGPLSWDRLRAFQIVDGREVRVPARFVAMGETGYRFDLGAYDRSAPLVIDPTLSLELSSYWGGTSTDVFSNAVAFGNRVYVTGRTVSTDFPVSGSAPQSTFGGGTFDLALFAYAPASGTIVYSSYFGGSGEELQFANSTAIDGSGNVYVTGRTSSTNYPTASAFDATYNGGLFDAFLTKFTPTGTVVYSTYLGGSDDDQGSGIAANSNEEVYVASSTKSSDFPTANALDSTFGGGTVRDAALTKFSDDGSTLLFSTYYGGTGDDGPIGVALDPTEQPTMYGFVGTSGITHVNPFQGTYGGSTLDGLIVTYADDGSSILYSTYLGGNGLDSMRALGYDSTGRMVFDLTCGSTTMPTVNPFQASPGGGFDNYLGKFNLAGSALEYASFYGGSGTESPFAIGFDERDNSFYVGSTASTNLPLTLQLQGYGGGTSDFMVFSLPSDGSAPRFATYIGGSLADTAQGIAIDSRGEMWIAGQSTSTNFPEVEPLQAGNAGATDAIFMHLTFADPPGGNDFGDFASPQIRVSKSADPSSLPEGAGDVTYTYVVTNPGFPPLTNVSVADDRCSPLVFVGGDFNGDGQLQSYDEWTYACTTRLSETTANTVTAVGYANGIRAEATATLTVDVADTLIEVMVEGLRAFINVQTGCRFFDEDARLPNQGSGSPERLDLLCPGDFITTPSFRTVYYVTREFVRRPFFNALVFLTHQSSFQGVKTVTDATLLTLKLGDLMAPEAGTVLVKFQDDSPSVYALFENPADPFAPIARVLETEDAARANFGGEWADFVIDLPPTMFDLFVHGAPIVGAEEIDRSLLLRRRDLEAVTNPYTFAVLRKLGEMVREADGR